MCFKDLTIQRDHVFVDMDEKLRRMTSIVSGYYTVYIGVHPV